MNVAQFQSKQSLSDAHAALARARRCFSAEALNAIVNDPDVRPHIGGADLTTNLDLSGFVANTANIALMDNGAAALFDDCGYGVYEMHAMALASRQGSHLMRCTPAFLHWMLCRTDALEIVIRIPEQNTAARTLAIACNFHREFDLPNSYLTPDGPVPAKFYSLSVLDWMRTAPGLVERGQWFHQEIERACQDAGVEREDHPDNEAHDRYVGAAFEMILGGQIEKAVYFFNRFSAIARSPKIVVLSASPLVIHLGDVGVQVEGEHLEIVKSQ